MDTTGSKCIKYRLLIYSPFEGFMDKGLYNSYNSADEAGKSLTRYATGVSYKIVEVN